MLMVVFGAGASYDSVPTYPPGTHVLTGDTLNNFHRPPLANELFANRPLFASAILQFPECQPIVPRLRTLGKNSLESVLQDLQSKAIGYPRGGQQLAAVRYYLQYILTHCPGNWRGVAQGITNYKSLLDLIERGHREGEPVCLVTFNYDTLLEDALSDFGLRIEYLPDYTKKHPYYRVFKLHGSVNWAREVSTQLRVANVNDPQSVAREMIERIAELEITNNYALINSSPPGPSNGKPTFPAIAIPVEKKANFECPSDLIAELTGLLPQVSKLLLIGWRATEAHFLELLTKHLKPGVKFHVVAKGLQEVEEIKVRVHRALLNNRPASGSLNDEGFTDFILSRSADEFLAS
jgi:hypothetical protein